MDSLDPSVLPIMADRKGSLLLRSNHLKYSRGVLDSNKWHEERESLPMDYDIAICEEKDKNLLKSSYKRIGNLTDGSLKDAKSTTQEALNEVKDLKDVYTARETHQRLITYDNFIEMPFAQRDTKRPKHGYGSVLPRHPPNYRKGYWDTTTNLAFQYPFEWTPKSPPNEPEEEPRFCRTVSEFADIDGRKVPGINTFMDDAKGTVSLSND